MHASRECERTNKMQRNRHSLNSFKVRSSQFIGFSISLFLSISPYLCMCTAVVLCHSHSHLVAAYMYRCFVAITTTHSTFKINLSRDRRWRSLDENSFHRIDNISFFFSFHFYFFLFLNINFRDYDELFFSVIFFFFSFSFASKIRPSWQLLNASLNSPENSSTDVRLLYRLPLRPLHSCIAHYIIFWIVWIVYKL